MDLTDHALIEAISSGLPLSPRPYHDVGQSLGLNEDETIARLQNLVLSGVVRRFGVVVRHHELGYRANAMVVWNVPDLLVDAVGRRLAACDEVTLCYRRPRRPGWPYNLFTMIHGRDRDTVKDQIQAIIERENISDLPHDILFSTRRFKQCGARYGAVVKESGCP